jgi:hypothetical protein
MMSSLPAMFLRNVSLLSPGFASLSDMMSLSKAASLPPPRGGLATGLGVDDRVRGALSFTMLTLFVFTEVCPHALNWRSLPILFFHFVCVRVCVRWLVVWPGVVAVVHVVVGRRPRIANASPPLHLHGLVWRRANVCCARLRSVIECDQRHAAKKLN